MERALGPVGRIMQIVGSIDRGLAEGMILKNKGRRARMDIDIIEWQKQTIQHEVGANLTQREWGTFSARCHQPEDGKKFEVCREPETREGKEGDRAHDVAQTNDHDEGRDRGRASPSCN